MGFKVYNSLRVQLVKDGFPKPGSLANRLLRSFFWCGGRIYLIEDSYSINELCGEYGFVHWRGSLIKKGWLQLTTELTDEEMLLIYRPGHRLQKYLDREIEHRSKHEESEESPGCPSFDSFSAILF